MQIYIDTADINEIKKASQAGIIDGVTTNPSLMKKAGHPPHGTEYKNAVEQICRLVPNGLISAEVLSETSEEMVKEAKKIAKWKKNIVVKIPMGLDGLKAVKTLKTQKIKTNVTLVFTSTQALLAAKAGASYVSPFVGRLDDISENGMEVVKQIKTVYTNYGFATKIIVASIRSPRHIAMSAFAGADIATVPPDILWKLFSHPLTNHGIKKFLKDAEK